MEKKSKQDQAGLAGLKPEERKSWFSIALIWAGAVICVPPLMVGAFMATGQGFTMGLFSMFFGYAFCVFFMIFMSFQASDLGVPTTVMVSGGYGKKGSRYVISLVLIISFIAWFGMQAAVCGEAFSGLLQIFGISIPGWVSVLIWGLIMTYTAYKGIDSIKLLNTVAVPVLIVTLIVSTIAILVKPDGFARILAYKPENPIPLLVGLSMGIGGFSGFTVFSGDFTRYCKSRRDVLTSCIIGVIPCGVGTLLCGAILAINAGVIGMDNASIVAMLASIGSPLIGLMVLVLATWTTNVATGYSAGFALLNLTGADDAKRPLFSLLAGTTGTLLAIIGILNYFAEFLNFLAAFMPPIMGVAIMDYFIICKGKPEAWSHIEGVNWAGIISWVAGSAVALLFPNFLLPVLNGIVVTGVLYMILYKAFYRDTVRNTQEGIA